MQKSLIASVLVLLLGHAADSLQITASRRQWLSRIAVPICVTVPVVPAAHAETAFLSVSPGFHEIRDDEIVEAQQARGEKVDLNNAGIVEYKEFPGMFPRVAGLVCSHGPYRRVKDFYSIPNVSVTNKLDVDEKAWLRCLFYSSPSSYSHPFSFNVSCAAF